MDFLVTGKNGVSQEHQIIAGATIMIGRDSDCDLVLDDMDVSRKHLEIQDDAGTWTLTDHSSNGTYMGSHYLHQSKVEFDLTQIIQIGPFAIRMLSQERVKNENSKTSFKDEALVSLRRSVHLALLDRLNLGQLKQNEMDEERLRPQVQDALTHLVQESQHLLPSDVSADEFISSLLDEVLGLGPLERLLADSNVSEIMVVHPGLIYCEKNGSIERTDLCFTDDESARAIIERIVTPLGRRIDESTPYVDARLKDGSRVNAVIRPLALQGACITIRKFSEKKLTIDDLVKFDSMSVSMARFLARSVKARKNIVISGGTGSGKTTLLNVLSQSIAESERVVTIEDAAELNLGQEHIVSLESRPPNMEGNGEITIRDLVRNALRMRPDRILIGECRGGEAIDMLQAMNTGHDGSMTTTHANNPNEAVRRLETLVLMSGIDLPGRAIREQIASSIDLIVQQSRLADGSRRVTSIAEIVGIDDDGQIETQEVFRYRQLSRADNGSIVGRYQATGYLPTYLEELITLGLITGEDYL